MTGSFEAAKTDPAKWQNAVTTFPRGSDKLTLAALNEAVGKPPDKKVGWQLVGVTQMHPHQFVVLAWKRLL